MNKVIKKTHFLFLFCLLTPFSVYPETTLTITSGRGEPFVNSDHNGFYDLIVKNMFKRIGVDAEVTVLPSERSLINANSGVNDGNIARIKGLEKKFKNLIRVPEKIIDFDFVLFTKNKHIKVEDWEGLEKYNVSFINGWKFFEKKVKHYKSLVKVRDSEQLFGMLNKDRTDIVLYDLWSGLWWLKQQNSGEIFYLDPPIARLELYLYINKKHQHLVPELVSALIAMKQDGTYQQIYNQSLNGLLK